MALWQQNGLRKSKKKPVNMDMNLILIRLSKQLERVLHAKGLKHGEAKAIEIKVKNLLK